jgi:hypothetical protein
MSAARSFRTTLLTTAGVAIAAAIGWFVFADRSVQPPPRAVAESVQADRGQTTVPSSFAGVDVQLARVGRTPEPERLPSPATTRVGDRLRIGISSDRELYVYAFNQEAAGAVSVMFPLAALDRQNPLPPGEHELPGTVQGQSQSYTVESRAPSEDIVLVLAGAALPALEEQVAALSSVTPGTQAPAAGTTLALDDLAQRAQSTPGVDVAIHRWTLQHAAPE